MGFLCGGETWTRVGPPIPLSTANAMAKGAPKTTGAAPRPRQPPSAAAPAPAGASEERRRGQARSEKRRRPVGDICLLPEIAGFAH